MKKWFSLLAFVLPVMTLCQLPDSAWIVNNYTKKEVYIPMRDGVKLFTVIYSPKDQTEQHPIIMARTGYSCKPYGEGNFMPVWASPKKHFFRDKYIYVQQDVRGRWKSEGTFIDIRPCNNHKQSSTDTDEASDAYDTIDWLVKNVANNNNRVGVLGTSYPGFYAIMAALSNHPSLKAVSPQAPVIDWYMGDDYHHNGVLMLMDAYFHYKKPVPKPTPQYPNGVEFPVKDNYEYFLRAGNIEAITKIMGDTIAFWKDLMAHPLYDSWWQERNVRNYVQNISPAIATLEVGGLFDGEDLFGALNLYKAIEEKAKNNNKIVMGPWSHGQWGGMEASKLGNIRFGSNTSDWFSHNIETPFFDYYLKGKGSADAITEATVFFSGSNTWQHFSTWPPANTREQTLYLADSGRLSFKEPAKTANAGYSEYISDPAKPVPYAEAVHLRRTTEYMTDDQRFAARRPDVLVFQTDILKEDMTLAGPVIADLLVSISTTDADFVVKLIDVYPDDFAYEEPLPNNYEMAGYQMLVRGDIFRGKFRNSFQKPEPFIPNKPTRVTYTLQDIAHTFKKGHRIMVQVQSSWFPLFDRNPQKFIDIYHAKITDFQKSVIHLFHDRSKIIVRVQ